VQVATELINRNKTNTETLSEQGNILYTTEARLLNL